MKTRLFVLAGMAIGTSQRRYYSSPRTDPPIRQFLMIAALVVALCVTDLSAEPAPLTRDEIDQMLDTHNAVRQSVANAESQRLGGKLS